MTTEDAVTAVWRRESVRLVAALTRMTRDLDLAEDLAQDALVTALEQWPEGGVPANPGAWLMAVAKRRAIDQFRRNDTLRRRTAELAHGLEEAEVPDLDAAVDHIEDDVLRLAFLCCHPVLPPESRAALTLRLVGGLTTQEIARAYLVKDATMGQRISRAKRLLAESGAELENPTGAERWQRLTDVMAVVYLVFNEGYSATSGDDWTRPDLCREAMRLARMLAHLAPDEPEVHGLQALLEIQGSRLNARHAPDGTPILLDDQDRRRWDQLLIRRGLAALDRAEELAEQGRPVGSYVLQGAIAACHARARRPEDTDWTEIAGLYDVLARIAPGPVVEVNRAVAHGRAFGPDAGLAILAAVENVPGWHLVAAVRGDLLERAGRQEEAARAFRDAAALTRNADERRILLRRAQPGSPGTSGRTGGTARPPAAEPPG
ncbi:MULTISPECIES: RNA polymerase sigma factor [unclassified Nocardioides]|uniref:RNA polymerase sigma factor n=1 Tax=Nocardioides sp. URHA0032 TaxID=1380388 RepID=UPI000685FEE9|nr:RNA polymerase sigma factor [Nocardioides sp. URHA0032]